jgi:tRNA (guanine26-N2/guanine27-N2)-dimethyltransferase
MGARILLGLAARELARLDKAMHPLLTHVTEHYVRVYLQVVDGAKMADQALERMGYLEHCGECRSWKTFPELDFHGRCALCDSPTKMAGPLWLGPLHHEEVVRAAMGNLHESNVLALRLLKSCLEEIDIPLYYDHHDMCKRLGLAPSKIERVIADLRDRGWRASRTHFSGIGIKTDASVRDLEDILRHR